MVAAENPYYLRNILARYSKQTHLETRNTSALPTDHPTNGKIISTYKEP